MAGCCCKTLEWKAARSHLYERLGGGARKGFLLKWNAIKLGHGQLPVGTVRLPDSSAVQLRLDRSLYRRRYLLLFLAATRLLVRLKIRQSTHYRIPDRPQNYASLNPWYWNYFSIVLASCSVRNYSFFHDFPWVIVLTSKRRGFSQNGMQLLITMTHLGEPVHFWLMP